MLIHVSVSDYSIFNHKEEFKLSKIIAMDVIEIDGVTYSVEKPNSKRFKSLYPTMAGSLAVTFPSVAFASDQDTFHRIWNTLMTGLDWAAALVIVFSGVSWMLGHRTKAIELLIGVCCGFILARHAIDIRDMLKTI